jgi:hypothetical protein
VSKRTLHTLCRSDRFMRSRNSLVNKDWLVILGRRRKRGERERVTTRDLIGQFTFQQSQIHLNKPNNFNHVTLSSIFPTFDSMAFCRRCGDIVSGPRCNKCGGASVGTFVTSSLTLALYSLKLPSYSGIDSPLKARTRIGGLRLMSPKHQPPNLPRNAS